MSQDCDICGELSVICTCECDDPPPPPPSPTLPTEITANDQATVGPTIALNEHERSAANQVLGPLDQESVELSMSETPHPSGIHSAARGKGKGGRKLTENGRSVLNEMHREIAVDTAGRKQWRVTSKMSNLFITLVNTVGVCGKHLIDGPLPPLECVNFNLLTFTMQQRKTAGMVLESIKTCSRRKSGPTTKEQRWKAVCKILWAFGYKASPRRCGGGIVSAWQHRTESWNRNGAALHDRGKRN